MRNVRLCLAYDGTGYHGSQRQANGITVQECLERAIHTVTGEHSVITACSRTDAGVHARAFYCNFKTRSSIPEAGFPYALRQALPEDIVVREARDMPPSFHARFDAVGKEYVYTFLNAPFKDPLLRNYAWHVPGELSFERMEEGAAHLVGTHDFSAFTDVGGQTKTMVRTIKRAVLTHKGPVIRLSVEGDGFLYHMVRILAGTLYYVGRGKLRPDALPGILLSGDRTKAGPTAPPHGLLLNRVEFRVDGG